MGAGRTDSICDWLNAGLTSGWQWICVAARSRATGGGRHGGIRVSGSNASLALEIHAAPSAQLGGRWSRTAASNHDQVLKVMCPITGVDAYNIVMRSSSKFGSGARDNKPSLGRPQRRWLQSGGYRGPHRGPGRRACAGVPSRPGTQRIVPRPPGNGFDNKLGPQQGPQLMVVVSDALA